MKVRELMSTQIVTLHAGETLDIADQIMSLGRIRHLPVLDDSGALRGIVSQRDLFRGALARLLGYDATARAELARLQVREVMTASPLTVGPDVELAEAARVMLERKIGCLPVIEDGQLVGLLTEADFVKHLMTSGG
jgi:CBS domain-containing membrane protein